MKTFGLFLVAVFLISTSIAQEGWNTQESGTNKFLTDVCFTDLNNGWITGWTGTILHTINGGDTWVAQSPPPNNAYEGIFFTDTQTGWAVGYGGKIIHTDDEGVTWDFQVSGTSLYIFDLFFLNQDST